MVDLPTTIALRQPHAFIGLDVGALKVELGLRGIQLLPRSTWEDLVSFTIALITELDDEHSCTEAATYRETLNQIVGGPLPPAIDPPRVAEGALLGQRPGAAEASEDRESSSGTTTARRPVGSAPTAPESLDLDPARLARTLRGIHGDLVPLPNAPTPDAYARLIAEWYAQTPTSN
jgi:hypothetical protein